MPHILYNNIPFDEVDPTSPEPNLILGQFMTAWSQVERFCGFLFLQLAEMNFEVANTIFERIDVRRQIEILEELVKGIAVVNQRDLTLATIKEVQKLSETRNKIVHAGWCKYDNEPARLWHGVTNGIFLGIQLDTPKGKVDRIRCVFTLKDISAATTRCVEVRDKLHMILKETELPNAEFFPKWGKAP